MNYQLVFNAVARHLLTQARRATTVDSSELDPICFYCAHNGDRCAIGCLIPDRLYDPEMENTGVHTLLYQWPALCDYLDIPVPETSWSATATPTEESEFLDHLRKVHDRRPVGDWPQELRIIAHNYGLHTDEVNRLEPHFKASLARGAEAPA